MFVNKERKKEKMLNKQMKEFMKLCTPSRIYLALSLLSIGVILLENLVDSGRYCLGGYSCKLDYSNMMVFALKLVYVAVFTIILDSLCKNKYNKLAWALLLLPYVLMFVILLGFIKLNK